MTNIFRYLLLTSLRDYLFHGLIALLLLATFVSVFLGGTALVEQSQMQLAYIAGSHRAILVCGMIILICLQIRRQFDNKEIPLFLTLPHPRHYILLSYLYAYVLMAILVSIPTILLVLCYNPATISAWAIWSVSLVAELVLACIFALALSLVLNGSMLAVLASVSFYLLSRAIGFVSSAITTEAQLMVEPSLEYVSRVMVKLTSLLVPRLDLFTDTNWLIYGVARIEEATIMIAQFVVYLLFLVAIAISDFRRKEF